MFQLGAGVSLALSVFKEPVAIAEDRVASRLERQLRLLGNSADAEDKRQAILHKKAELRIHVVEAEALSWIPKKLILIGVVANFVLLFASVIWADVAVSPTKCAFLLLASLLPYALALVWLEILAASKIRSVA